MNGYKLNLITAIILTVILLLGLGLQFESIYSDYFLEKIRLESSSVTNCFYSTYQFRLIAPSLGMLGLLLSFVVWYEKCWKLPKSIIDKFLVFSPLLILVLDQIMVEEIF